MIATILLSLAAALVPTLIYTLVVWWLDRYEREPGRLMAVAFIWGAMPAVVLSVFLEIVLGESFRTATPRLLQELTAGSLLAPVIEESAKGIALLLLFALARHQFDNVLDGIVYGAVIGFGFAMTENTLYYVEAFGPGQWEQWTSIVALRSLLFGLSHAFYTAIAGAGLGLTASMVGVRRRWLVALLGLFLAIAFHAVHNLGIALAQTNSLALTIAILTDWGGIILLLGIVLLAWRQERRWIQAELLGEVGYTLSPAEYETASSYGRRFMIWFTTLEQEGWRAARRQSRQQHLITRLAFLKHRQHRGEDSAQLREQIMRARAQISTARAG